MTCYYITVFCFYFTDLYVYYVYALFPGINKENKHYVRYPHGPGIPVPAQRKESDACRFAPSSTEPIVFTQAERNDLTRDLYLPKESAQVLPSDLLNTTLWHVEQHSPGTANVMRDSVISSVLMANDHWFTAAT